MNYNAEKNNRVYVYGEIISEAQFSHEVFGLYMQAARIPHHALQQGNCRPSGCGQPFVQQVRLYSRNRVGQKCALCQKPCGWR